MTTPTTAFGPQGPNYATVRPPADPQASAGADTFFKNCSAAGAKDGTFATADFFNVTLANLRYLCREAGVPLTDADDTMVYQAVKAIADQEIQNHLHEYLFADKGIKINVLTGYIESTLGDGSRPVLT
jgi:hypothetical protein